MASCGRSQLFSLLTFRPVRYEQINLNSLPSLAEYVYYLNTTPQSFIMPITFQMRLDYSDDFARVGMLTFNLFTQKS